MCGGFQRVFEESGGKIVQKLWPPLISPDYGTYIAQLKTNLDGLFIGFAGSNGYKWAHQLTEYGLRDNVNMIAVMPPIMFTAIGAQTPGPPPPRPHPAPPSPPGHTKPRHHTYD